MAAPGGAWRSKTAAQARAAAQTQPAPAPKPAASKPAAKPAVEAVAGGQAVDERMLFVASVLIGYTVRVEVRRMVSAGLGQAFGYAHWAAAAAAAAARRCRRGSALLCRLGAAPCPLDPMPQVKSGEVWEGIFHALRPAGSDFDVLLRWAKPVPAAAQRTPDSWDDVQPGQPSAAGEWQPVRPQPLVTIVAADLVQISATDVRMGAADVGNAGGWDDAGGFGTDAAISRARGAWGRERELQRWTPDESEASHMLHLEEAVGHVERGWDQFAVRRAGCRQGWCMLPLGMGQPAAWQPAAALLVTVRSCKLRTLQVQGVMASSTHAAAKPQH